MLRRSRPKDEVLLLENRRHNQTSVVLAFDLGLLIAGFIDVAEQILNDRGRQLSSFQKRQWQYHLIRDFLVFIDQKEDQWLNEDEGTVRFWFWQRNSNAILNRKWNAFLRQTGPGGIRRSLKRFAQEFMAQWVLVKTR